MPFSGFLTENVAPISPILSLRGVAKFFGDRLFGREIYLGPLMGARNFLGTGYGGAKFFVDFRKLPPTGYPALKKTNP